MLAEGLDPAAAGPLADRLGELLADGVADAEAWVLRGRLAAEGNKATEVALASFDSALALDPQRVDAWIAKGNVLTLTHRYEEAIVCYKRATELKPDRAEARYLRAVALMAMERYREALAQLELALQQRPAQLGWWYTKLDVLVRLSSCADTEQGYRDLAQAATEAGLEEQVLQHFETMTLREPDNPLHWFHRGSCLAALGHPQEAIECCDAVLQRQPDHGWALYCKARCCADSGAVTEALNALAAALQLAPELKELAAGAEELSSLRHSSVFRQLLGR